MIETEKESKTFSLIFGHRLSNGKYEKLGSPLDEIANVKMPCWNIALGRHSTREMHGQGVGGFIYFLIPFACSLTFSLQILLSL